MYKARCFTVCYKRSISRICANIKDSILVVTYNANRIFWKSETEAIKLYIAMASLLWSFLLFWPGDTFSRPTYKLMAEFGSETTWAILFLVQGLAGLIVLLFKCKRTALAVLDSILGCILWTGSCMAMILSAYPPPAAISAEIVAAWFSWWLLLRLPLDK